MKYKLLALDIDGTILNDRGQLTPPTIQSIRTAVDSGVKVVLCTGRSFRQSGGIVSQLGLTDPLIAYNGAAAIDPVTRNVIDEMSFPIGDVAPFISHCRKYDIHCSACTAFDVFVERMDDYQIDRYRKFEIHYSLSDNLLLTDEPVMKFTVDDRKRIGGWQIIDSVQKKYMKDFFMNVMHPNASKAESLARLARSYGIGREEVMAIGNFYNDLGMLEYAGLGVAMGNAPWQIKQRANAVTASNKEDGVHLAIHKYLLK
ncbi:Cof-type HAD-IIB family hydrolase [Paenibacillus mesophilus]|uniref:Cof-type HAD-IIB family hydrolase n=1 Tax=Paenibacillus mesophilus TaxID=2582849 RepID=UPI0013052F27|nr:Cof-type HAD-IIB family hydrolase [Paenibacillus mesophilus]